MSSPLIPSALDASTQAFPILTPAQIARIRPLAKLRPVRVGDVLFKPDDTNVSFFVLLSGGMEIVQPSLAGYRPIATHQTGGFTARPAVSPAR
jgi:thioredoxin reductase (NADPH)